MVITPRPYQAGSVAATINWWAVDQRYDEYPLIVLPTGGGKTIVFSLLCQEIFSRGQPNILILAHRKELITQAEDKLLTVWPDAPTGVYAAGAGRRELRPITIASRDTFVSVLDNRPHFDVVIVDEAHNISRKEKSQYQKIIQGLKEVNPNLVVVGFTATPYRTDSGLIYGDGELFADIAYEAKVIDLIRDGYLCPITAKGVSQAAVADTSSVRASGGDFNLKQMGEQFNTEAIVKAALADWHRIAYTQGRKCTAFFCVHVDHAMKVSEVLAFDYGIEVPVLTANTPQQERDEILSLLDAGELPGVANVGILTEGWDCPRLDCIALLRATKSLGLYIQMVGRGLRLHPDKENTLVLDFGENIKRFGPIDVARPPERRGKSQPRSIQCQKCETINKPYAKKCEGCGEPLYEAPTKICPGCGLDNPPSAGKCYGCGHLFISHETTAAEGALLSTDEEYEPPESKHKWYTVSDFVCRAKESARGNLYLSCSYTTGLTATFTDNLMIGFRGRMGAQAMKKWRAMTLPGTRNPRNPDEAVDQFKAGLCRRPKAIKVDTGSTYNDIIEVTYHEDTEVVNDNNQP